jgi:hypothetical protein
VVAVEKTGAAKLSGAEDGLYAAVAVGDATATGSETDGVEAFTSTEGTETGGVDTSTAFTGAGAGDVDKATTADDAVTVLSAMVSA